MKKEDKDLQAIAEELDRLIDRLQKSEAMRGNSSMRKFFVASRSLQMDLCEHDDGLWEKYSELASAAEEDL